MTYAQLAGRRQRILREIEQAQREAANVGGRLRRLREEFELIEFQIAARCIPRLTEVVTTRALEPARGTAWPA